MLINYICEKFIQILCVGGLFASFVFFEKIYFKFSKNRAQSFYFLFRKVLKLSIKDNNTKFLDFNNCIASLSVCFSLLPFFYIPFYIGPFFNSYIKTSFELWPIIFSLLFFFVTQIYLQGLNHDYLKHVKAMEKIVWNLYLVILLILITFGATIWYQSDNLLIVLRSQPSLNDWGVIKTPVLSILFFSCLSLVYSRASSAYNSCKIEGLQSLFYSNRFSSLEFSWMLIYIVLLCVFAVLFLGGGSGLVLEKNIFASNTVNYLLLILKINLLNFLVLSFSNSFCSPSKETFYQVYFRYALPVASVIIIIIMNKIGS